MFPQGGPGIGLLLLRMAAAGMFALNLYRFNFSSNALYWVMVSLIFVIALGLILGFLTPILAIIASVGAVLNLALAGAPIDEVYVLRTLTSASLVFLGPGAYSVDARLFGLRVTVVPPRKDKTSATT